MTDEQFEALKCWILALIAEAAPGADVHEAVERIRAEERFREALQIKGQDQ